MRATLERSVHLKIVQVRGGMVAKPGMCCHSTSSGLLKGFRIASYVLDREGILISGYRNTGEGENSIPGGTPPTNSSGNCVPGHHTTSLDQSSSSAMETQRPSSCSSVPTVTRSAFIIPSNHFPRIFSLFPHHALLRTRSNSLFH